MMLQIAGRLKNMKIALIFVPLLVLSVGCVFSEKIAPDFPLVDIDGVEFSLSDYRGNVVLLDFFATWCGSCVAEFPHLKGLHEEFGEDLVIMSISVSSSDTVEVLRQFRQAHEIGWIVARDTVGISMEYGVSVLPTLTIVDQYGFIRHQHVGLTSEAVLREELSDIITKLVGDLNYDGTVDIFDVVTVSIAFGSKPGDSGWNLLADLNNDGNVDIFDVVLLAQNFGKTV